MAGEVFPRANWVVHCQGRGYVEVIRGWRHRYAPVLVSDGMLPPLILTDQAIVLVTVRELSPLCTKLFGMNRKTDGKCNQEVCVGNSGMRGMPTPRRAIWGVLPNQLRRWQHLFTVGRCLVGIPIQCILVR